MTTSTLLLSLGLVIVGTILLSAGTPWRRLLRDYRSRPEEDLVVTLAWDHSAPSECSLPRESALALVRGTRDYAHDRDALLALGRWMVAEAPRYAGRMSEIRRIAEWDRLSADEQLLLLARARDRAVAAIDDSRRLTR